jgi:hypothetical protein
MMTVILTLLRWLGLPGIVAAGALVFYEGLPAINYVTPYLRIVPAVGPMVDDLAQGRVGRAREAGRMTERMVWQDQARQAEIARAAARRLAEEKIEAAERDYVTRQTADALRISDLEKALKEEITANEKPVADGLPSCHPVLSRRLRDAIDAVGRD